MPEFVDSKFKNSSEMCDDILNKSGVALLPGSDFGFKPRKPIRIFKKKVRLKNWGHKLALVHTIRHLTCVKDNTIFDTWDCRPWCMNKWYSIEE